MSIKISAVIITYNEEEHIENCLQSLKSIADEIIVVDSFSTDKTWDICVKKKVKFIRHKFEGYIEQKNYAVQQAKYDLILSLDADESLSEEAQKSILFIKQSLDADAYSFNRLTRYCGNWIHYSGWYPDKKIRLFNRKKAYWGGKNPHDKIIMSDHSIVHHLQGDVLHHSYESISEHIQKIDKFTTIAAQAAIENIDKINKKHLNFYIIIYPFIVFLKNYFLRFGCLDGYYGFLISINASFYSYLKYVKIKSLLVIQNNPENNIEIVKTKKIVTNKKVVKVKNKD